MKKNLQKMYNCKALGALLVVLLMFLGGNSFGQITTAISGSNTIATVPVGSNTWTCPEGVTSIQVEAWGGGGGGGGATNGVGRGGGGGAGGAYVKYSTVAVSPGTTYNITVGTGGAAGLSASATSNAGNCLLYTSPSPRD
jgi:hypothetical protein